MRLSMLLKTIPTLLLGFYASADFRLGGSGVPARNSLSDLPRYNFLVKAGPFVNVDLSAKVIRSSDEQIGYWYVEVNPPALRYCDGCPALSDKARTKAEYEKGVFQLSAQPDSERAVKNIEIKIEEVDKNGKEVPTFYGYFNNGQKVLCSTLNEPGANSLSQLGKIIITAEFFIESGYGPQISNTVEYLDKQGNLLSADFTKKLTCPDANDAYTADFEVEWKYKKPAEAIAKEIKARPADNSKISWIQTLLERAE